MPCYYDPETGRARIVFRYPCGRGSPQFSHTVTVGSEREAQRYDAAIEETISDLTRGKLTLPPDADADTIKLFIVSGGKVTSKPQLRTAESGSTLTLGGLFDRYESELTPGSKGDGTRDTERVHARHFRRVLGAELPITKIDLACVQRYVDKRAKAGVDRPTIVKELATLSVVWRWVAKRWTDIPARAWSRGDLTLPKTKDRPPFQTYDQITEQIERGHLGLAEQADLWECLWLKQNQTLEVLSWVKENAPHPVVYPLFVAAAYTGARRGELLRSERSDWDFESGVVVLRETKCDQSKLFTRRHVPLHPDLATVMHDWFRSHPGGPMAFVTEDGNPIMPRLATRYFRRAVAWSRKWRVLHGWHIFRHSLASNLASAGKDPRIINEILGHRTGEMEMRYRHLCPQIQADAIRGLFCRRSSVGARREANCAG